MAQLMTAGYRAGNSFLHELDARTKFGVLFVLVLTVMNRGAVPLAVTSLASVMAAWRLGLSPRTILADMRYFMPLLAVVFAARAFTTPGAPPAGLSWLPVSCGGLLAGALTAWRLLLAAFLGLLFVASTRPSAIKAAVVWFLGPLPKSYAQRIGTMLGLLLRFIPLVFSQAGATMEAQRARGVESRKNPIRRLTCFVIPFLRRLFLTADRLTDAMEARCFTEIRTEPLFCARARDRWVLGGVATMIGLLWLM